jgi:hypothetical protein
MGRTPRPVNEQRALAAIVLLINECTRDERPCPTVDDVMLVSGLPRRRVGQFLHDLIGHGVIELEQQRDGDEGVRGGRRRMRVFGRDWTGWSRHGDWQQASARRWPQTT